MWNWNIFKRLPKPFYEGYLPKENGHKVYFVQYGNPKGIPVLSFHGGPGGSSKAKYASIFDLKKYHFIQFDQRGCGKSEFKDLYDFNNTSLLLHDAKRLIDFLQIKEKIVVQGCSWGSTMALLFAEAYPEIVAKIIVFSIFLARPYDYEWVNKQSERFYPDLWQEMRQKINHSDKLSDVYWELLNSQNEKDNRTALAYLGSYEYMLGQINPQFSKPEDVNLSELQATRIAFYYERNNYFLEDNQILNNAPKIAHIPTLILHNRFDFCCPLKQAFDLHLSLPNAKFIIVPDYGHMSKLLWKNIKHNAKTFAEE